MRKILQSSESSDASSGLPSEEIPSYSIYSGVTESCRDWDCQETGGVVSAAGDFLGRFGSAILGILIGAAVIAVIVVIAVVLVKLVQKRKAAKKNADGNYVLLEGDEAI